MRTFRMRLAASLALATLLVLLVCGTAVFLGVQSTLRQKQDEFLREITQTEIESGHAEATAPGNSPDAEMEEAIVVWDHDTGQTLFESVTPRSPALRSIRVPFGLSTRAENGVPFRILKYRFVRDNRNCVAVCAVSEQPLRSALGVLGLQLAYTGVAGSAMVCVLAWLLAGRLTEPLRRIALQTAAIRETDLGHRLPHVSDTRELRALTDGMNDLLTRLDAVFRAQNRFVADAAHELRSPLASLRIAAEVALRRGDPITNERALRATVAEIDRLSRLTESLLTLSRADSGTLRLALETIDLGEIATAAVDAISPRAASVNVAISLKARPALVRADSPRVRQIFDNLLDNAIRHSPPGGTVRVTIDDRDGSARVSISDDGPGIAPENRDRIFERFWREDESRFRGTGGFGLGLAIVRTVVDAHGGTIEMEGPEAAPFTIHFVLPK